VTLVAAILLFLAVWIVIPAPNAWLLPLGVGVPEVSPILLAASVIALLLCFRGKSVKKIGVLFSLAAAGLSAIPLSQVSSTVRTFDAALAAAFPNARPAAAPAMRPSPIVTRDLFLGIKTTQPRISRGAQFASPEGLPLVANIYRPEAPGKYPVLLLIHGGSWQRGTASDNETFAWYFANRGYVVMSIEYRLAPRWRWPAQLEDVRSALESLRTNERSYEVDSDRMAIIGWSAGGHLALASAYSDQQMVRAVVSFYGPADLTEGWNDPPKPDPVSIRTLLEAFMGGTPEAMPFRYREASPITYAGPNSPATLQIQGLRDHVVRPRFARDLHQRLKGAGARSTLLEIPWAEHAFDQIPQGLGGQLSLYYTERFLAAALAPRR
jgi:acetyl esterase/lipase